MDILITSFIVSFAINMAMFLVAYKKQSDKLTDISYAVSFITIALYVFSQAGEKGAFHIILTLMIVAWGIRLGGFLFVRVLKNGKDARFDEIRGNFKKFLNFWTGQALAAWVLLLPMIFSFSKDNIVMTSLTWLGFTIWLIGWVIEFTADLQKYRFGQNPKNKDKWIQTGIWKYSRHPNYFGEILVWIGVYTYTVSALSSIEGIIALASPLFISYLLLFVSGLPPLEKGADKKWGSDPKYREYKKKTSVLIPLPRR
jgi:steroid 5-alpha reductase family enzyme